MVTITTIGTMTPNSNSPLCIFASALATDVGSEDLIGSDTTLDGGKYSVANDRDEEKSESEDKYENDKNSNHHDGECSIVVSAALGDDSVDNDKLAEVAAVAAAPAARMTAAFSTYADRGR